MKCTRILAIAALPLLSTCGGGDSTSPAVVGVSGAVSFEHTGGGGPFSATGALSASASSATQHVTQWAAGAKVTGDNSTLVVANIPRTGGLSDAAVMTINRQTTGAGTIDPNCTPTSTVACSMLVLVIGVPANGSVPASQCFLQSGTITIASISGTSATGSFSGSGICLNLTTLASTAFTVTNGSFNVPLVANVPAAFGP